jgi:hypothetical protein
MLNQSSKLNYGIDAPGVIRNFLLIGIVMAIGDWFIPPLSIFDTRFSVGLVLCGVSLMPIALGISMLVYGIWGSSMFETECLT